MVPKEGFLDRMDEDNDLKIVIESLLSVEQSRTRQTDSSRNLLNFESLTVAPLKNPFRIPDRQRTK
jgi:hypothetical protein